MLSLKGNGLLSPETNFKVNYRLHVVRMEKRRGFVGEPDIKRPLRKPRRRWVHIIKMDLPEVRWGHG
jgi:hypothetical protein